MKNVLSLLFIASFFSLNAQITISEILFERPSWNSDLQYIELFNNSEELVNISEWSISGDLELPVMPDIFIRPFQRYLICNDLNAIFEFGLATGPDQALTVTAPLMRGRPFLTLIDPNGEVAATIDYDSALGWPIPEEGVAIELCDPSLEVNNGLNWALAETSVSVDGNELLGTPGNINTCTEIGTSAKNITNTQELKIFPNPVKSILEISTEGLLESIKVYNNSGIELLEAYQINYINVSGLAPGLYNILLTIDGVESYKRFAKL